MVIMEKAFELVEKLSVKHSLEKSEYEYILNNRSDSLQKFAQQKAAVFREKYYKNDVYIRGLIEISNICRNDCLYCGIRKSNKNCKRYRLTKEEILSCCDEGYRLGFRTFVMQGGEDPYFNDDVMCEIIENVKLKYPDCAVTLSLGERSFESYRRLYNAGADRYLLRHETADEEHYKKLHPSEMSFKNRIQCLKNLKEIGYQVGCGFMVGSPFQTNRELACDLKFIEEFSPDMCGIGPFISQSDTPFKEYPSGTLDDTLFLLSLIRIIKPNILLPATTALGTIDKTGREKGLLAGANVVMPNLSPVGVRKLYSLYDNKICTGEESAQCKVCLSNRVKSVGFNITQSRGDINKSTEI